MANLIVGFSSHKKFNVLSKLIQLFLGTKFSHVYVKLHSDTYDRDIIYQASGLQVNFVGSTVFEESNIVVEEYSILLQDETKKALMTFCIDNAGIPYGIKELFGMALVIIAEKCGKTIKNPFADGQVTYVCSELVGYVLKEQNLVINKDLDVVTPLDIEEYVKKIGTKL